MSRWFDRSQRRHPHWAALARRRGRQMAALASVGLIPLLLGTVGTLVWSTVHSSHAAPSIALNTCGPSPTATPVPAVAEVVYGQPNFTTGTLYPAGPDTLKNPSQLAADGQGGVYVVDYGNSRLLHFPAYSGTGAGPQADLVYGQPNFTASAAGTGANRLNYSHGVVLGPSGGLYIADTYNNRVLHFPPGSTVADRVYGQPNFTSSGINTGGLSAHSLDHPQGIALDNANGLYVADSANNRVLHFPRGSTTADAVYGQSSFTSSGASSGTTGLNNPRDVTIGAAGLLVADTGNHRILRFTPGNSAATRVYGQTSFTATAANQGHGPTAYTLNNPTGIAIDQLGGLYIADRNNNRVLFFLPSVQTATGNDPAATAVYGQAGFTSGGAGTTAVSFHGPGAVSPDANGNLFVLDIFNQRLLKFPAQECGTASPTPTPTSPAVPTATPTATATATPGGSPVQLSNLVVSDTANAGAWSLQTNVQVGAVQYGDRGYTLAGVPAGLVGAPWVRTANTSKAFTGNPTVTFNINQQATVYLALDIRLAKPAWMDASWTTSGLTLTNNEAAGQNTFVVYQKTFSAGTVALGPNDTGSTTGNMYTVIVV